MNNNLMLKNNNSITHDIGLRIVKCINALLMTTAFGLMWFAFYSDVIYRSYYSRGNYVVIALFMFLYVFCGRSYDAFLISYSRVSEMIYSQIITVIVTDVIMYVITVLLARKLPGIVPYLNLLAAQALISVLWCFLSHKWYYRFFKAKRTAIVWDMREGLDKLLEEYDLNDKFNVVSKIQVKECLENIDVLKDVDVVFLSGIHSQDRNIIIKYCILNNIKMFIIPRLGDTLMSGAISIHMLHLPLRKLEQYNPPPEFVFFKRVFDIVFSLAVLILLSPLLLIIAILVKSDGGPVFYKQIRLTKGGREFKLIKFRSMCVDAEKDGIARLSSGDNDDRITKVGRFIRKTRIDELPQLFNTLKGDMSIVGPRPERPEIAEQYEKELPEFKLRLQAKAGLTGYAQVYGKYNTTPYDKLQMDLMYIANPGFVEELKIMFATLKILFVAESTEGVKKGATTAMEHSNKEYREEKNRKSGEHWAD